MGDTEDLLIKLIEECSEVQKECTKALRFGIDNFNPDTSISNLDAIRDELLDVKAVMKLIHSTSLIDLDVEEDELDRRIKKYTHYKDFEEIKRLEKEIRRLRAKVVELPRNYEHQSKDVKRVLIERVKMDFINKVLTDYPELVTTEDLGDNKIEVSFNIPREVSYPSVKIIN